MKANEPSQYQKRIDLDTYEKNQRHRTLSTLLIILMIALAIFGGLNLFFYESQWPGLVFLIVSALCLPTLWLNYRGHQRPSEIITTLLVFFIAHYNLVDGAGLHDPGTVAYPLIILIGGLLFGKPAIPVFTATGIVSLLIVVWLDTGFTADIDRLLIISVLLLAGAGATWAVLENTENNINRIKESEENLRQALEESRKHSQRVLGIIETVPEGVLLLNKAFYIRLANQNAWEYLAILCPDHRDGEPLKALGQFSIRELIHESGNSWQDIIVEAPPRIFEAAVRSVQKPPTPPQNWVLVLRDATLERQQQEFLREQDRLATVGQLASGIAHDFRNILSVISTYSQIVQKRPQTSKHGEYLNVIQDQINDAVRLIEQILDFGRRTIMQRQALDAAELIENVITILKRTLPSTIAIEFIQKPGHYVVHADRSRMQQALLNLALNARDAMPDGGTLTFFLGKDGAPDGYTSDLEAANQDWLSIRVSDSGMGIQQEDLPNIFEPFFTTKETGKGTGLGLAQVYGIVKQHGGEITVTSEQNRGTTFTIYLPAISEKPVPPADRSGSEGIIYQAIRVLLVEDNDITRTSTEEMLKMLGCKVIAAENGHQAFELYAQQPDAIDLVLSDIVMPGMNGIELYQELQKIGSQLKFLVITGYPLNRTARQLLEEGRIDWIQKPFMAEALSEKIVRMTGKSLKAI